jgi:hypothetical protein
VCVMTNDPTKTANPYPRGSVRAILWRLVVGWRWIFFENGKWCWRRTL